jgi:hypothetical protein
VHDDSRYQAYEKHERDPPPPTHGDPLSGITPRLRRISRDFARAAAFLAAPVSQLGTSDRFARHQVTEAGAAETGDRRIDKLGLLLVTRAVPLAPAFDGDDERLHARGVELDARFVAQLLERNLLRQCLPIGDRQ